VQRSDGNAVAVADRHALDLVPLSSWGQGTAALLELDLDLVEEAHLAEEFLLPGRAQLVGDLGGADVGTFLHDLGHRTGATERVRIIDRATRDVQLPRAVIHLAHRFDGAGIHRHGDREGLEGRT
jgi:hypothetical protein